MEKYQELEETRLDNVHNLLQTLFNSEKEWQIERCAQLAICESVSKAIMKTEEIKLILELNKSNTKLTDELIFTRATSKYEKLIKKFDDYYSRGSNIKDFDIEKTRAEISQGLYTDISKEDLMTRNELQKALSNCWEGREISKEDEELVLEILKERKGRVLFADAFNEYRKNGIFCLSKKGFEKVSELLYKIITLIAKDCDTVFALDIMILTQTFYLNPLEAKATRRGKIFVLTGIQKHPFWLDKEVWKTAIRKSLSEEKAVLDPEVTEEEKELQRRNLIFGKLGAFGNNMMSFNIDEQHVNEIITSFAREAKLSEEQIKELEVIALVIE